MFRKNSLLPLCLILFTVGAIGWLITTTLTQPWVSANYPYPPGYPGTGEALPNSTPTPIPLPPLFGKQTPSPSPTAWATPTPYTPTPPAQPRQGVSGGHPFYSQRHQLASWGYNWGQITLPNSYGTPNPYNPALPTVQHLVMIAWRPWNAPDVPVTVIVTTTPNVTQIITATPRPTTPPPPPATLTYLTNRLDHHYWLVFNECESSTQCRTDPRDAATFLGGFIPYMKSVDPDVKLIVGGVNAHKCGVQWLEQMTDAYNQNFSPPLNQEVAGWHFHLYPDVVHSSAYGEGSDAPGWIPGALECDYGTDQVPNYNWVFDDERVATVDRAWQAWQRDVQNAHLFMENYGEKEVLPGGSVTLADEIWITEMGCLNAGNHLPNNRYPVCQQPGYLSDYVSRIMGWLNNEGRWIDRYNWFIEWDAAYWYFTRLYDMTPTPSYTPGPTPTRTPSPVGATPTQTPTPATPYPTLTPTYQKLTALGTYYAQITPNAPVKWVDLFPNRSYLPILFP